MKLRKRSLAIAMLFVWAWEWTQRTPHPAVNQPIGSAAGLLQPKTIALALRQTIEQGLAVERDVGRDLLRGRIGFSVAKRPAGKSK